MSQNSTMLSKLPPRDWLDNSLILDSFLETLADRGLSLYPAQEEAVLALYENNNVILNTPTGSGKSLVATALHLKSLAWGNRSVYTCPIKALVNEKFIALCKEFGSSNVGIITGDSSVNSDAPILCCTAEILSNMALRYGIRAGVDDVIMDEFHYYSDKERGSAWQIPLLTLPDTRFLLMSATLGDVEFFKEKLTELNGLRTVVVKSVERPVPLDFRYEEVPLHETISDLIATNKAPIYLVHFTQMDAADEAQNFLSTDFCSKEEKRNIALALEGAQFDSPYGKEINRLLRHGIGLHHAGLLPKYRILVEKLAQQGLLKIICGTDTLGVGVNVPIRTVVFTKLCKFDGEKTGILSVRDFMQISGRAGRKGFDDKGTVVVQAPEHVVENMRMEQKAAGDPKKLKKVVKKKPPTRGFVPWTKETFIRIVSSQPEPLISRFKMTHGILLNMLSRERHGVEALRELIRTCHETDVTKKNLRRKAFELFRSLYSRNIIEFIPTASRTTGQTPLRVNVDLQLDFSLNQDLSLYLLDTIKLIPAEDPCFALRVLSLVESIQENPDVILGRQVNKMKSLRMAEMKMEGLDYEDRIAELEKIEYPKPDDNFSYETFNAFQAAHPWLVESNIRPKSIAREMYENFQTFDEYIREYDIGRSEGVLLRYLSSVYNALSQTVPDYVKNEDLLAIEEYFATQIYDVDSSLLDEWRGIGKHQDPQEAKPSQEELDAAQRELSAAEKAKKQRELVILARNAIFRFVRAFNFKDFDTALKALNDKRTAAETEEWTPELLAEKMALYETDHEHILFNAEARAMTHTNIQIPEVSQAHWRLEQTLLDPDSNNDWVAVFNFDPVKTSQTKRAALRLLYLGQMQN